MMSLAVEKTTSGREYKVKDISLADLGRLEIERAETEMAGLMGCRTEFGPCQPFKGARINVTLVITTESAVFIETLTALGAEVRCWSSNATEDHAAAAIARDSATVFAWSGCKPEERLWCRDMALNWPDGGGGPDLIVDSIGETFMLINLGVMAEDRFQRSGKNVKPNLKYGPQVKTAMTILKDSLKTDPKRFNKIKDRLIGVSNETSNYLQWMHKGGNLVCPTFDLSKTITKTLFGDFYGCRHSLPDELVRATGVMISGKFSVVCGYGYVGKGCAAALKNAGARVVVIEIDPICALQALMEGFQVLPLEEVVSDADIFVAATGNKDTIMVDQMRKMKNNAIVCSMGRRTQIDLYGLQQFAGRKMILTKIAVKYVFLDTKSGIILLSSGLPMNSISIGHSKLPGLVMSCLFTNHTIALLQLWNERVTGKYKKKVYVLPKHLEEKVAALHLPKLGAKLTKLSKEQADYIHVPVDGPYKPANYRY